METIPRLNMHHIVLCMDNGYSTKWSISTVLEAVHVTIDEPKVDDLKSKCSMILKPRSAVTQSHQKWYHLVARVWFPVNVIKLLWP